MRNLFAKSTLLLCVLLLSVNAIAYDWEVNVTEGKGTAYVEIYNNFSDRVVAKTDNATNATYKSASTSVLLSSTGGWPICHATADPGYSFSSWYCVENKKQESTSAYFNYHDSYSEIKKNWTRTFNARFTPNPYTITLDKQSGGGGTSSISVTFDANTILTSAITVPTRAGYTFDGYYTSGGTQLINASGNVLASKSGEGNTYTDASRNWKYASSITLYAHWTANNYTITLKSDLATSHGTESIAVTFDSNTNLTSAITCPSRDKWTFWGYFTGENGAGTQIIGKDGNVIASVTGYTDSNQKWKYAGDITLYAYMTEKSNQTITWDLTENVEYATGTEMGAMASSGLPVTYTPNAPGDGVAGYINENGRLVVVEPNQPIIITASQAGNDYYNPAPDVSKTIITLGANPNQTTEVTATGITYGQTLSASTLSGNVKLNGIVIPGTLSWVDPSIMPNAGTANHMVLFTPDNTAVYGSIYFEVPVIVAKADPVITWNIGNILREEVRYDHFVTSSNKENDFSISVSNTILLKVSGTTLRTGSVDNRETGLTITLTQEASDNYNRKTETKTVAIYPKAGICLPFNPMDKSAYDEAMKATDGGSWCNTNSDGSSTYAFVNVTYSQRVGIQLGSWDGGFNYNTKSVELFFSGIPDQISFDYELQTVHSPGIDWPTTAINWYLYESADDVTYTERVHRTNNSGTITYTLNENTRYVRITYGGNFAGFIKNLTITQKRYIRSDKAELTFGTDIPLNPLQEPQALTLSYSSLGLCGGMEDAITVTSSNPAFYVDETTITENVGIEQSGEYVVRVRCNDVNQSGTLTFTSNDGTSLEIPVSSEKPAITTSATAIFQTGTEHNPVSGTAYRAQRTLFTSDILEGLFNGSTPLFDTLYIYGVSESAAASREWVYSPAKGYNVPVVTASNVHTPCFVYKKEGAQYTYVRTFDASTKTLNIADSKKCGFVGYRAEAPATTALQLQTGAAVSLNNTEIVAANAAIAVSGNATIAARGANIVSSASKAAIQLAGTATLTINDSWKIDEPSAILALRPASGYPSIDLGSASGRVDIYGTQLELHNAANMAIAHMDGTTEKFDGEVHINDGSIGGAETLGMPKLTFIDGGTFNDGTVVAYTLKGQPKRPRNSRGEIVSRQTMTKTALEAYDWYGQAHLTLDGSAKVNPMLMDEEVWIFNGTNSDHSDDATSWNKESVPGETADVLINAPMVVSGGELKVKSLTINWEDKGKGIPAVTVNPDGGLTVGEGGIDGIKVNMVKNLALKAGAEGATKGQTGFLRIHPNSAEPMPAATVELYSKAYYDMTVANHNEMGEWQFVGYPMRDGAAAKTVFNKSFLYDWNTASGEWENNRTSCVLQPFEGYATSQYRNAAGWLITFTGELVQNVDKAINLAYNAGDEFTQNMVANSYSAPIDVTKFEDSDFDNMQGAVYIFNTGSRADIANLGETRTGSCNIPGQYLSIPIGSAAAMKGAFETPTVIAPMQGFCVHATGENAQLRIDYEKLVWYGDYATNKNEPLHINARKQETERVNSLCVSLYGEGIADNLYMLESDKYDAAFENGYDAKKMNSGEANIFSVEGEDHLSVDATSSFIGTHIGVRTGDTTAYVMVFTHLNSERPLALLDNETNETIDINEGTEYTFFAVPNSEISGRFIIVESANAPAVTTGIGETNNGVKVQKFIKDGQLYILKNGVLYTATGAVVR